MRTSFVEPIRPSTPSTMSSFRDASSSETGRRDCLLEKPANRYVVDVPTATPRENRSSDLGRDEKDMSSPNGGHVKLRSQLTEPRGRKFPSIIKIDLSDLLPAFERGSFATGT